MKRKSFLVLIGSICSALVIVVPLFIGACAGPTSTTDTIEPQKTQGPPETAGTVDQQETQEPSETATPSPEVKPSPCEEFIHVFEKEGVTMSIGLHLW